MPQLTGKFVWFENVTSNPKESQRFYGEVLGWKVETQSMGPQSYDMIKAGDAAIGGYSVKEGPAHWISYLSVADVNLTAQAATKAGGKVVEPAYDIPTVGRMAKIADPAGAKLFLFKGADANDAPDTQDAKPGTFFWNELYAPDGKAALAFYEKLAGYGHEAMDMGPMGTYRVLKTGEVPRAGILEDKAASPEWLPYVAVDDCDAALTRAKRAGATIEVPGTDIPNIGRFGIFRDPQGARLAVMKPSPRAK